MVITTPFLPHKGTPDSPRSPDQGRREGCPQPPHLYHSWPPQGQPGSRDLSPRGQTDWSFLACPVNRKDLFFRPRPHGISKETWHQCPAPTLRAVLVPRRAACTPLTGPQTLTWPQVLVFVPEWFLHRSFSRGTLPDFSLWPGPRWQGAGQSHLGCQHLSHRPVYPPHPPFPGKNRFLSH